MLPHILETLIEGLTTQEKAPSVRQVFIVYCAYALKASNWSKQNAAQRIGIGRATMYRMVQADDFKKFIDSKGWSHHLEGVSNAPVT